MTLIVKNVNWEKSKHKLTKLREKVFVYEWHIPKEYEFDQHDNEAFHILVLDEHQQAIATGRLTPAGEIGRIAVEAQYRKPDVYRTLFNALIARAQSLGLQKVFVQCELDGVEYYQRQGFEPVGTVYMEAGIARQKMACSTSQFCLNKVELTH